MPESKNERTSLRSHMAGQPRSGDVGVVVRVAGWVHRRRDLGGLVFVDLRDRSGLLQVSFGPDWTEADSLALAPELGHEDVILVEGEVALRPEANPELATGAVEVRARKVERVGSARTPAIPVYRAPDEEPPSEELRLKHRVLDLRRPEMQGALQLRHRLVLAARNDMDGRGFVEVETPILTKPTPEGARDYLVPSRVHKGEFYALPQSPQIYKQLLMVAGFDRYFQIARCFRDEDLRADRQPEFTQIDIEASFVVVDDILALTEGLMGALGPVAGIPVPDPIPRLTYGEAMERYGCDRPDLRWSLDIQDWTPALKGSEFHVLRGAVEAGGRIRGLRLKGGARLSRKQIESMEDVAKGAGAAGLLWAKRSADGGSGPLGRFLADRDYAALGLEEGDLALVAAGADEGTSPALAAVRLAVVAALELPPETRHAWLWVTDFPLFHQEDGQLTPSHHPFVMPHPEEVDALDTDPASVRGLAYDLVYNGTELGGGSIRIHQPELQRRILRILGFSDGQIDRKFGFLLEALACGAPPHGGIALGMDRIAQRFAGMPGIRDVIAFPKTTTARALFEGAPSPLDDGDLQELGIRVRAE
ncbi:MAG TPA: aspartate--tRNA ligase [Longimicrobiales bacterium]|jgi:aspartyl-tRNA synthetase